jgi:tripartite-type tricarboxylate transporter receptor subunit TctC
MLGPLNAEQRHEQERQQGRAQSIEGRTDFTVELAADPKQPALDQTWDEDLLAIELHMPCRQVGGVKPRPAGVSRAARLASASPSRHAPDVLDHARGAWHSYCVCALSLLRIRKYVRNASMQPFTTRSVLYRFLIVAMTMLVSNMGLAQAYPTRPIHIVVPSSPGAGVTDIMARLVGQHLSVGIGQQIVIDNRPGASGILGSEVVSRAAPDGYTLLIANVSLVVNPYLYPKMPYDPLKDFMPVTMVNSAPLMLVVHPSITAKSVTELIAYAKSHPGQLNYGSGGLGSTPFLAAELFKSLSGIDVVHVPYKGGAPALSDLVGGQLSFMIENMPGTMPYAKAGNLRALAITSPQRSRLAPDLPTMAEAGVPGYEMSGWNGIFAVKGTAPEIVLKLHSEVAKVLHTPEVRQELAALGAEPVGDTPEEFGAFLKADMARWGKIIQEKNIRSDL